MFQEGEPECRSRLVLASQIAQQVERQVERQVAIEEIGLGTMPQRPSELVRQAEEQQWQQFGQ